MIEEAVQAFERHGFGDGEACGYGNGDGEGSSHEGSTTSGDGFSTASRNVSAYRESDIYGDGVGCGQGASTEHFNGDGVSHV